MHTRALRVGHGPTILVRPLRNGDLDTVLAFLHRVDGVSRRNRRNGAQARLTEHELWELALVDATHHALVAYVDGDPDPVAFGRLVRSGRSAELAVEVAADHRAGRIGAALARALLADAQAAGITEITASVPGDNPAAAALLRQRLSALGIPLHGAELWIRGAIARPIAG
ncbi:MAG TPA: GNAT family N-acetyltransferase [Gaiellaceae bacterium]|jgi:ribosomal protein S18 acetylase RimI-like enzyme